MNLPLLVLDLETYYDKAYSLRKMTISEYVADARFKIHGLAIRYPDGRCEYRTDVSAAMRELQIKFGEKFERAIVVCHNGYFDLYVLNHKFDIRPIKFIDTKLLAYHVHGRKHMGGGSDASLKSLATLYSLPAKGALEFMCGVAEPNAVQQTELAEYACNDAEITYQLALKLLPHITNPAIEIPVMAHTVRMFTERSVKVDVEGIAVLEQKVIQETMDWFTKANVTVEQIKKDKTFTALLEAALARTGRLLPLKQGKNSLIPAVAKKDEAMLALLDDADPVVATLAHARVQKKSEDQLLAKLATLKRIALASDGYLSVILEYSAAVTGRFAGGGKFNAQNLGREGFGLEMRKLLMARPGHKLVTGDAAQIEARVLAWCTGQREQLDAFRSHSDLYSKFSGDHVFHCEVRKSRKDDPPLLKEFFDSRRQVGKEAMLGLGFSMGALRFANGLRTKTATAKLFADGTLTPQLCREIVNAYRDNHPEIPQFWADLDDAFRQAIIGVSTTVGPVRLERRDSTVFIWLPSGRALRYPNARLEERSRTIRYLNCDGQEAEFSPNGDSIIYGKEINLYGGKLTENIVQAIARDFLVEAILRLEAAGWEVLFHVHDEIVLECPDDQVEACKTALANELRREPTWAPGLPLDCDIAVLERYAK